MAKDREKKPRRRRGGFVDVLNGLLTLVLLGLLVGVGAFFWGATQFYREGGVKADTQFLVEKGSSLNTVAQRLAEQGLIVETPVLPSNLLFYAGARMMRKEGALKAGVYMLKANASMADVLKQLTEGDPIPFFVNVIPGDTSWQVAQKLNDPIQSLTGDPVTAPKEGTLLAVRYDFFPGDSRQSVLDAMQNKMAAELQRIWAARDPAIDAVIKTPADLVTLASIVEKETGLPAERPQVAAVFINRLKKNMRLQTDPTVLYGVSKGQQVLMRSPTSAELKQKTPYNTYQIDGLPAGPIANPGTDALEAAAHPAATKDLYFVAKTADPADGHLFAATYAQHRKNVTAYRAAAKAEDEAAKDELEADAARRAGEDVSAPATP